MFYNQDGSGDLISHNIEKGYSRKIESPKDATWGDSNKNLYNVKHSGYYDFEVDENGLWVIYKQKEMISSKESLFDTYVIAKIDEEGFNELKFERNWYVKISKEKNYILAN